MASHGTATPAPPPLAAEETRIEVVCQFELAGMKLEAVRVHRDGEQYVLAEEAIRRADLEGMVIRLEEDWTRIYEVRNYPNGIPSELNSNWLATARPHPDNPRRVSYLYQNSKEWYESWYSLDSWLRNDALFLCRCT